MMTTHKKDFLFNLASLFSYLNANFNKHVFHRISVALTLLMCLLFNSVAFALPSGWDVVEGDVSFHVDGNTLNVSSNSQQAIAFNTSKHC